MSKRRYRYPTRTYYPAWAGKRKRGVAGGGYLYGRSYFAKRRRTQAAYINYRRKRLNTRIGGFLGVEKKYYDTFKTSTSLVNAWAGGEFDPSINCLAAPTPGTGASDRDGNKILIKSIHIRGLISFEDRSDQDDVITPQTYTIMLVQDQQTNGAQLNAEDVMTDTAPKSFSFRNIQYTNRFKVLKRWSGTLTQTVAFTDGANTGSVGGNGRSFSCNIKCNIPVNFQGSAGNVADITDNSLHLIACATSASTLSVQYACRVRFVG